MKSRSFVSGPVILASAIKESLKEIKIFYGCPYYHARLAIAVAVDRATVARTTERTQLQRREHLFEYAEKMKRLAHDLNNLVEKCATPAHSSHLFEINCSPELAEAAQRSNEALDQVRTAAETFARTSEIARDEREQVKALKANADIWGETFAEFIGYLWHDLTGKNPSSSSAYFKDFVRAAYECIGGQRTKNWTYQIRKSVERINCNNGSVKRGFGRFERGRLPRGVSGRAVAIAPNYLISEPAGPEGAIKVVPNSRPEVAERTNAYF